MKNTDKLFAASMLVAATGATAGLIIASPVLFGVFGAYALVAPVVVMM